MTALGHQAEDVTDIVLTHLDLDHAGGLGDFPSGPGARVRATSSTDAMDPPLREKARYCQDQWAHGPHWVRHRVRGEEWFGFDSVTVLGDDVLLVPLRGHTHGHCGVAVTGRRAAGCCTPATPTSSTARRTRRAPARPGSARSRAWSRSTGGRATTTRTGCGTCSPSDAPT